MRVSHLLLLLCALSTTSCSDPVDLTRDLQLVDVATGWIPVDDPRADYKVVPAIEFKFKNASASALGTLQANVLFRRAGEEQEWGSSFVRIAGTDGLAAQATSTTQRVLCPKGYTGTEAPLQLFKNSQFVDARVKVFAKYGSTQWQPVGEFQIDRRLLP